MRVKMWGGAPLSKMVKIHTRIPLAGYRLPNSWSANY